MNMKDEVREAQTKQFEEGNEPEEVRRQTFALYDSVDALSNEKRRLLVDNCLALIQQLGTELAQNTDTGQRVVLHTTLHALTALAGYANGLIREALDETSLGDKVVTETLDAVRTLVRTTLIETLDDDHRDMAKSVEPLIRKRIEAGEDYEVVTRDEIAKYRAVHPSPATVPGEVVTAKADDDPLPGMYL